MKVNHKKNHEITKIYIFQGNHLYRFFPLNHEF